MADKELTDKVKEQIFGKKSATPSGGRRKGGERRLKTKSMRGIERRVKKPRRTESFGERAMRALRHHEKSQVEQRRLTDKPYTPIEPPKREYKYGTGAGPSRGFSDAEIKAMGRRLQERKTGIPATQGRTGSLIMNMVPSTEGQISAKKYLSKKAATKVGKKIAKKVGPVGLALGVLGLAKEAKASTIGQNPTKGTYVGNKPILPKKPKVKK